MRKNIAISIAALSAGLLLAGAASAAVNLVNDGGFETNGGTGQLGFNTNAGGTGPTGWTTLTPPGSYALIFNQTTASTAGAVEEYDTAKLYGPITGDPNSKPGDTFFLGADPGFQDASINQTITGLVVGKMYQVSFDFAGAQQQGFNGATIDGWNVSLNGFSTPTPFFTGPTIPDANNGFTGWDNAWFDFTATSSTVTLGFLASGTTDAGEPPFALLDNVSLVAVPEPSTWALMIMGFGGIGAMVRNRRRQQIAATA